MSVRAAFDEAIRKYCKNLVVSVAPFISKTMHITEAVDILKSAAAVYLVEEQGLTVPEAAEQLGMSNRWIYNQLKIPRQSATGQETQRPLRHHLANHFLEVSPESCSVLDCEKYLESKGIGFQPEQLVNAIGVLCRFGMIEAVGTKYKWKQELSWVKVDDVPDRATRASELVSIFLALVEAYIEGRVRNIHQVRAKLTRKAQVRMLVRIEKAIVDAVQEAIRESLEAPPEEAKDWVDIDGLVVMGVLDTK